MTKTQQKTIITTENKSSVKNVKVNPVLQIDTA